MVCKGLSAVLFVLIAKSSPQSVDLNYLSVGTLPIWYQIEFYEKVF